MSGASMSTESTHDDSTAAAASANARQHASAAPSPRHLAAARARAEALHRAKLARTRECPRHDVEANTEPRDAERPEATSGDSVANETTASSVAPLQGIHNLPPLLDLVRESEPDTAAPSSEEAGVFQWLQRVTTPSSNDMRRWPRSAPARASLATSSLATGIFFRVAGMVSARADDSWSSAILDRREWPTRPLRIGVCEPTLLQNLERTTGQCVVEWVAVPTHLTPHEASRRYTLDAHLRMDARGGLLLTIPESRQRQAAWHDWSMQRPVTFANLFPGRVDCSELTLSSDVARPGATWFLRCLIEAAAGLSRHPSRLSTQDRLNGRTPRIDTLKAVDLPPTGDHTRDAQRLMIRGLWESLREASELPCRHACVPAARLVTAFVAGVDDDLPESNRSEMAETSAALSPQEPEVMLRLAATRFANYADSLAIDALLTADRLLRGNEMNAGSSQLPFLQAELEAGRGTPLSLGRVAAGVAMICASLDTSKLAYFRDDVLDDARYSDWLIPKDQDRRVLVEVFRAIMAERAIRDSHRLAA